VVDADDSMDVVDDVGDDWLSVGSTGASALRALPRTTSAMIIISAMTPAMPSVIATFLF
jgi:hypothetical protein